MRVVEFRIARAGTLDRSNSPVVLKLVKPLLMRLSEFERAPLCRFILHLPLRTTMLLGPSLSTGDVLRNGGPPSTLADLTDTFLAQVAPPTLNTSDVMEIVPDPNQEPPLPLRPRWVEMEGIEENLGLHRRASQADSALTVCERR